MPDHSHKAKRLVDAAVVNGPFTYAGFMRYVQDSGWSTVLEMVRDYDNTEWLMKSCPRRRTEAKVCNDVSDTQSVDAWIAQNPRYS